MDDYWLKGICLICGNMKRHFHTADDVQKWQASLDKSSDRHPAGRKLHLAKQEEPNPDGTA